MRLRVAAADAIARFAIQCMLCAIELLRRCSCWAIPFSPTKSAKWGSYGRCSPSCLANLATVTGQKLARNLVLASLSRKLGDPYSTQVPSSSVFEEVSHEMVS